MKNQQVLMAWRLSSNIEEATSEKIQVAAYQSSGGGGGKITHKRRQKTRQKQRHNYESTPPPPEKISLRSDLRISNHNNHSNNRTMARSPSLPAPTCCRLIIISVLSIIIYQQLATPLSATVIQQNIGAQNVGAQLELFGGDELAAAATVVSRRTSRQATTAANSELESEDDPAQQQQQLQPYDYHANMPVITKRELANAIKQAAANIDKQLSAGSGGKPLATATASDSPLPAELLPDDDDGDELAAAQLNSVLLEPGTAGWLASSMFHRPAPEDAQVANQTRQALVAEETTRLLARQFKLTREQIQRGLPLISVDSTPLGRQCPRASKAHNCVPGRYRSLSGHCNNVQQPDWGAAQTPLVRYAPARYADHVGRPVRGDGSLPSARQVSIALHEAASATSSGGSGAASAAAGQQHSHMTTMLSFFGQFLFHDLAFVPQFSKSIKCCPSAPAGGTGASHTRLHPECMPIETGDAATSGSGSGYYCLDYVRSAPAVRNGCNLGPRDQLNLVSSYLDGSVIYGSSEAQLRQLRAFTGGRLRSQRSPAAAAARGGTNQQASGVVELLPQIRWRDDQQLMPTTRGQASDSNSTAASGGDSSHWRAAARDCYQMAAMRRRGSSTAAAATHTNGGRVSTRDDSPAAMMQAMHASCFQAGDTRANENLGLTLMHTIWMREHNLVADKLAALNRHWRDERLFEEARRIVVAELQQVAYAEFLPSILGEEVMQRFNLSLLTQGYFQAYEPALNPGVSNELATAVFPFILSTIPGALERYSDRLEMLGATSLADTFLDGSELFKRNKFAQYLTGMMSQSAMEPALGLVPMAMSMSMGTTTTSLTADEETSPANATTGGAPMLDVVALTIQQGRDHGLRSYLHWRRACQLRPLVASWQDLELVIPRATVASLRQVYASPEHLDLYLALLEAPAPGATLGPTLVCLLARQFYQLKHGDRFWFENDLPGVAFTPGQLDELRQTSLARVVCRNSQASISFIQPAPMLASDPFLNAYQYCTNRAMLELDLSKWRQPVTSAQQLADAAGESFDTAARPHEDFGNARALARGKRLIEENSKLISAHLTTARTQLDSVARHEVARIKLAMAAKVRARRHAAQNSGAAGHAHSQHRAGYRYLPRLKRQALAAANQSVVFELATNEVVRSLLRQGRDRERAQSLQADIRDFLYSLESAQLDNLLDNSAGSERVSEFIEASNGLFLSAEQRARLTALGDPLTLPVAADLAAQADTPTRSSSLFMNCQDDERAFPCDHTTPYRTLTGWCNNLAAPKFGQSYTQHDRILPSAYDDGLAAPRQLSVVVGSPETGERLALPSARLISTTMHDDRTQLHVRYSLALMQFGQFGVDHDLTRTPFSVALDGSLLDCSGCNSRTELHRDCLPIEIPADDAHFQSAEARRLAPPGASTHHRKCLHFVRSLNGQPALGPRQQLNALTAYLDASEIYGSDNCEAKSLRAFTGGRLNSSAYPAAAIQSAGGLPYKPREILPTTRANPECVTPSGVCFHAGDQRASEQPGLTAMHTIFLRLHNSIVGELAVVNRHWPDEKLYQQGRRIVGAIMQRITYGEFAPRLLGLDYMSKFDLMLKQVGYARDYDDSCSASILTEFAAAAFRMGHSLIRPAFPLLGRNYNKPPASSGASAGTFQLRTAFFNSQRILSEPQLMDSILRGIVATPIEVLDNSITEELTNHLFEKPREPFSGMDLIALNIQRARDHGIAGYNRYRVKCNLTRARSFEELAGEIPAKLVRRLASLYAHVDDIDLFTGGLSETPVHGGIIGPTFGCIIGLQLARLKRCDRFWHETDDPWVRFSAPQLAEIRKMTLAKVICSQSDSIDTIQRQAMDMPDNYLNPRVPCSSLPSMDLGVWRENQKSCQVSATGGATSSSSKVRIELGASKRVSPCRACTCTLEGPVCRTAKINCMKMMQRASSGSSGALARGTSTHTSALSQVMADKACLVQCAWALDMQL